MILLNIDMVIIVISVILNVVTTFVTLRILNEIKYNSRELIGYVERLKSKQKLN